MTHRHFKHEGWLYALAFFIALVVRLIALGSMPLTDAEAAPALQALRLSQGQPTSFAPHPFYILSTSIVFLIYGGGTNFLARFTPALVGSFFVLAPLLFENRLKPRPSLLLAFFIALDPGLTAISRQAASPIFAITFLAFTAGFINKDKLHWAMVTAAFALLSGPSLWFGLLATGITFAITQLFQFQKKETNDQEGETPSRQPSAFSLAIQRFPLSTFILAFIMAGTLFFMAPAGLGAAFASLPAFIEKWTASPTVSLGILLISPLVYQPLALFLAFIALVRGGLGGGRRVIYLSIWFFVTFLLSAFLPARQMEDLAWALLPLNALAALELVRHFTIFPNERREVAGVMLLTVFIWVFAWLGLSGLGWLPPGTPEYNLRAGLLVGSVALLIASLVLVAAGWSIRIAQLGGIWGLALGLGMLTLGGLFGSTGIRGLNFPEMWWLPNLPIQADLIRNTVSQVSEFGRGNDHSASVAILGVDSPALEWALRENPVQVVASFDPTRMPDFVITPYEMDPQIISLYRGQDFIWRQTPSWNVSDTGIWFRWATLREIPQTQEIIILWAKSDLFLDH
ncbi:MAG: hypothetical protein HXY38_05240 [Chloroflexi bacterium]|nr:hypothetical protein [Chloroflexota bacterium]